MTRVPEAQENTSASTDWIDTNPIPCPEEYETVVEVSSAESPT